MDRHVSDLSYLLDLTVVLFEPGDEVCERLCLGPAGVQEGVEDLDHVGVGIQPELALQPVHDLVYPLIVLGELGAEVF